MFFFLEKISYLLYFRKKHWFLELGYEKTYSSLVSRLQIKNRHSVFSDFSRNENCLSFLFSFLYILQFQLLWGFFMKTEQNDHWATSVRSNIVSCLWVCVCVCVFYYVSFMPNWGPKLTTLRSKVACFCWLSQPGAPVLFLLNKNSALENESSWIS